MSDSDNIDRRIDEFVRGPDPTSAKKDLEQDPEALKLAEELRELRATLLSLSPAERVSKLLESAPRVLEAIARHGPLPDDAPSPQDALRRVRDLANQREQDRAQRRGPDLEQ